MALEDGIESILAGVVIKQLISETQSTKDRCVRIGCNKETIYDRSAHISQREFYVEGAGQLCRSCYMKTYGPE